MTSNEIATQKAKSRAGNVIYGAVLTLVVLVVLDSNTPSLSQAAVMLVVTLVSVWAAKSYAYVIGGKVAMGAPAKFADKLGAFKENVWVLTPGIPVFIVLAPAAVDVISLNRALSLAQWLILSFLFVTGFWLRRQAGGTFFRSLLDGLLDCAIGALIVALQLLNK